ncbi:MAG: recombinase family protein [Clostridia bacterium]|nr:recombinase family protein [Clostridia bacterium]
MARIAYIRVSTQEQDTGRQDAMFTDYDKVFTEKISGKDTNRPQLQKLMEYVREGDTVTVESYSRFARNTRDLLELVEELDKKQVGFISLKEQIDTTTPQGRLMMTIFAGLAQFEREQTLQRQAEGIAIKKAHDAELKAMGLPAETYKGRKPIEVDNDRFTAEVKKWRAGQQTARETMNKLKLKPNTFYRRVKQMEEEA